MIHPEHNPGACKPLRFAIESRLYWDEAHTESNDSFTAKTQRRELYKAKNPYRPRGGLGPPGETPLPVPKPKEEWHGDIVTVATKDADAHPELANIEVKGKKCFGLPPATLYSPWEAAEIKTEVIPPGKTPPSTATRQQQQSARQLEPSQPFYPEGPPLSEEEKARRAALLPKFAFQDEVRGIFIDMDGDKTAEWSSKDEDARIQDIVDWLLEDHTADPDAEWRRILEAYPMPTCDSTGEIDVDALD